MQKKRSRSKDVKNKMTHRKKRKAITSQKIMQYVKMVEEP